ncbi:very long chain fatty acid elongase 7-like [Chironomus tepperi]|uniref:very long chain fatty acid elongase 7-like n=1 Tax=Chironomus tepperi TaxID=113505 RepID=UPI00391EF5C1
MELILPPAKYDLIESWVFLGSNPTPVLAIFTVYFILLKIGPMLMANRQPFKLTTTIRIYNIIQILGCSYFSSLSHLKFNYSPLKSIWKCETNNMYINSHDDVVEIYHLNWLFYWLRLIELFETMFFIMRKKQEQISFLHVYHHISTLFFLYLAYRYSAEVMDMFIIILNNDVHILMYIYYFLSSFKKLQPSLAKLKPIMTTIQIVQLILIFGQCIAVRACGISNGIFSIAIFNVAVLLIFFGNFYYQSYMKKKAIRKGKNE